MLSDDTTDAVDVLVDEDSNEATREEATTATNDEEENVNEQPDMELELGEQEQQQQDDVVGEEEEEPSF
jgi:hypothetical protein